MPRILRISLYTLSLVAVLAFVALGVWIGPYAWRVQHVAARPSQGFRSDYWLYVPEHIARDANGAAMLLVQPNNSGRTSDDRRSHLRDAWWTGSERQRIADELGTPLLVPAFPRTASQWKVYTHALDRDSLTTGLPELARPDLQLIAMIDDARARLRAAGITADRRVLIQGFSASGMFANRFTALHPDRVRAATAGSPGGWPIAPVASADGLRLDYPAGITDVASLTGRPFDAAAFARVPQLVYMGDRDDNDSLDFEDGWDRPSAAQVEARFGATPVARWPAAVALYRTSASAVRFELVPGAGHDRKALQARSTSFLKAVMVADGRVAAGGRAAHP